MAYLHSDSNLFEKDVNFFMHIPLYSVEINNIKT